MTTRSMTLRIPSLLATAGALAMLSTGAMAQQGQDPTRYGQFQSQDDYSSWLRSHGQGAGQAAQYESQQYRGDPGQVYRPYGQSGPNQFDQGQQFGQNQFSPWSGNTYSQQYGQSGGWSPGQGQQYGSNQFAPNQQAMNDFARQAFEEGYRRGRMDAQNAFDQQFQQFGQQAYSQGYQQGREAGMSQMPSGQGSAMQGGQSAMSQSEQMSLDQVRSQLERAGFNNVRLEDARYLVSATTPDGREVLLIANPTGSQQAQAGGATSGTTGGPETTTGTGGTGTTSGTTGGETGSATTGTGATSGSSSGTGTGGTGGSSDATSSGDAAGSSGSGASSSGSGGSGASTSDDSGGSGN